jgi:carboxyl-terminal processing protease
MNDNAQKTPVRKTGKLLRNLTIGVLLVVVSFGFGYTTGNAGFIIGLKDLPHVHITREAPVRDLNFNLFWTVWDQMHTSYFDKTKLNDAQMIYGAIKGMVASVGDPYTVFLTPSVNKISEDDLSGNFDGIGIQIGYRNQQLAVIAPLPETPAEKSGIKAGDYIVGIKDPARGVELSTNGISLPEAVKAIRGQAGSSVQLTLVRDGQDKPFEVSVVRANIDVPSVTLKFIGKNEKIAHLKVSKFGAETKQEWDQAVTKILATKELKGIVLDLRNNPGGYLQSAIELASEFVPRGTTVVIQEMSGGQEEYGKTEVSGKLQDKHVVILINKGSASASEILSGALRDQKQIQLIGDTSFGKGTVQEPKQLDDGTGIHVTIARWLTPSKYWVHDKGLEPDVKVSDDANTVEDEQLNKAIEVLENQ